MTFDVFIILIGYMLVSSYTPGPGNILALNTMIQHGWEKGKQLIFGIGVGYVTVQFISTLAVYGLNEYLSSALSVIKYAGAVYLGWLAIHIIISKPDEEESSKVATFKTGFLMQLVNVKIYFYTVTLLTVYIVPYVHSLFLMLLAGIFVVAVGCSATLTWAFLGLRMKKVYQAHYRFINVILSLFLIYCVYNIVTS